MKVIIMVFYLGSSKMVTSRAMVPRGEMESSVNPVRVDVVKLSPEELWEMFDTLKRQRCHIGPFMLGRQLLVPLDRSRHRRPPTLGVDSTWFVYGFRRLRWLAHTPRRPELVLSADLGISSGAVVDPTEQELGDCTVAKVDPTEQELGNYDVARVDPTEQELGNCNVARVDPTEHELGNSNVARVDPTEHELGNWDIARVDPTEQEFGNCNVARVDPTEHELGNSNVARVDLTKHELRNCDVALLPRVKSGANPEIWP
ncbi:hypothetical protein BHM03_00057512 [Ensete ventricosum]|nr:hypothetical protein BHM03_00057512 [Ensete ventricosum]